MYFISNEISNLLNILPITKINLYYLEGTTIFNMLYILLIETSSKHSRHIHFKMKGGKNGRFNY